MLASKAPKAPKARETRHAPGSEVELVAKLSNTTRTLEPWNVRPTAPAEEAMTQSSILGGLDPLPGAM